jgi:hypothetical protein
MDMSGMKRGYGYATVKANHDYLVRQGEKDGPAWKIARDWGRVSFFTKFVDGFLPPYLALPNGKRDRKSYDAHYGLFAPKISKPRKNPCGCEGMQDNPIKDRQTKINAAMKLYSDFTGEDAAPLGEYVLPRPPAVGVVIGEMVGVAYEATRDGETEQYFHRFNKKDRPLLVSSHDGQQLVILGGEYDFTENGIVDASDKKFSPRHKR